MSFRTFASSALLLGALLACGPSIVLPPRASRPELVPGAADSAGVALAQRLAPVLHLQEDEPFPLERVVAVLHPTRPIVAYHLLWGHDVNGQWLPWAKADDAEIVWVGYDSTTLAPTDLWTYWHGDILHADWRSKGRAQVAVQWGKHGSLPFGFVETDLRPPKTLNFFYIVELVLLPDIWLGRASHGGPWWFPGDYERYRSFSEIEPLADRLDAVVRADDPRPALEAVFGMRHADKQHWP